jgi:hypothetical protein
MVSRSYDGSSGIFVTTVDDYMDTAASVSNIRFELRYKDVELVSSNDESVSFERFEDGSYLLTMKSNTAALIVAR